MGVSSALLHVTILWLKVLPWETFGRLNGHLFPLKESYPEFGPSLFAGNDSLVMMQRSQTCPRPPVLARLSSPVSTEQKRTPF